MTESLLYFILGSSGLTIIVTLSNLFAPVRKYFNKPHPVMQFIYKVLMCPMCFGVYVGVLMWGINGTIVCDYLCAAGTVSLVSWIIAMKIG